MYLLVMAACDVDVRRFARHLAVALYTFHPRLLVQHLERDRIFYSLLAQNRAQQHQNPLPQTFLHSASLSNCVYVTSSTRNAVTISAGCSNPSMSRIVEEIRTTLADGNLEDTCIISARERIVGLVGHLLHATLHSLAVERSIVRERASGFDAAPWTLAFVPPKYKSWSLRQRSCRASGSLR